jgi:GNAT superfamily N-acetyltransferase
MTTITRLTEDDRGRWAELWTGYLTFYRTVLPPETYDLTWRKLFDGRIHGFGARGDGGRLIGITHYMYQETAWSAAPVCYLQDLYVDESLRGTGAGRKLIEAVAAAAKAHGAGRLYWLTQDSNAVARRLYDRLAENRGFIRYDYMG